MQENLEKYIFVVKGKNYLLVVFEAPGPSISSIFYLNYKNFPTYWSINIPRNLDKIFKQIPYFRKQFLGTLIKLAISKVQKFE